MKEKKISVNLIFSALKTLMGVLFPLITFPYATRVLGQEYIGKIVNVKITDVKTWSMDGEIVE